ncbi:MAG: NADH-quinone oxidoreductase subunit M [Deltaproteobacteria bacterium]|nr:NADH-quinone oxidoreductase subunit M [Deltaproteobacteria bacterium]MBW2532280.1 NADH-quinone oxidoreductase subunit M [Deltaproteobacteria bacterium]
MGQAPPRITLLPEAGAGTLELEPDGDAYRGAFFIRNDGEATLRVTRVDPRHSPLDPRLPKGVSVVVEGKLPVDVAKGQQQRVVVTWNSAESSAQELYGHVLVESNAAGSSAELPGRPVAIAVHAETDRGLGFIGRHILSILVFLPLLGVVAIFIAHLMGYRKDENLRLLTVVLMGINLVLSLWLYWKFDADFLKVAGNDGFQFIERGVWIRSLNAEYFIGIDGISVSMVVLTAIVSFCGAIASYSIQKQLKGYFAMYCLLVTGMMGTFVALDLILFFLFWEVMLLPMYFLIGIWGGPRRQYAAIKFFIYTLAGSVLMLLAFIFFYLNGDPTYLVDGTAITRSLAIPELARVAWVSKGLLILGMSAVKVLWVGLFIGFAIKIPMFPFHTWLPDAHVEAPTAISVILAGVLLKMGTYGILRFNFTLLPEATRWAAMTMAVFGVINILYGAFCAMAQKDLKRLVAYSSVSHMGFCLLGMGALTPAGMEACIVQMFNHGLITSMMFTLVGVVYDRVHTREIDRFGGMATEMPLYTAFFGFAFMASLGLPGLSGFWGEALTFIGAFPRYRLLTILAATGVIITAGYHLWALQRMFLGKFKESWRDNEYLKPFGGKFPEINKRELLSLAPLAILVLVLGFWPRPLLSLIDKGTLELHRWVDLPGPDQVALEVAPPPLPAADRRVAVIE